MCATPSGRAEDVRRTSGATGGGRGSVRRSVARILTGGGPGEFLVAGLVYAAITVWFTWPLAARAADAVVARGVLLADVLLAIWILSWTGHALASSPAQLFDGNAFHPARHTITGAENLLGEQPFFAPVYATTGNPVLAYNVALLSSFLIGALLMHLLVRRWTGRTFAAYVAAVAFAFGAWRLELDRPQLLEVQYFPLIVLLLDRALVSGSVAAALGAGLAITLQALCSYYVAYMVLVIVGTYLLVDVLGRGMRGRPGLLRVLTVIGGVPLALFVPASLPYLHAKASGVLSGRMTPDWVRLDRLVSPAFLWSMLKPYCSAASAAVAVLALPDIVTRWRSDRSSSVRVLGLAAMGLFAVGLAFGPTGLAGGRIAPYRWLDAIVPGFGITRASDRFASVAAFAASGLIGFAVARGASLRRPWVRAGVGLVLLAAVVAPLRDLPDYDIMSVPTGADVPPAYRWLAAHGKGEPLLELPIRMAGLGRDNPAGWAMYFSTYHWLPLVNGYTGHPPPLYAFIEGYAADLPEADALEALVGCTGVRWILAHRCPLELSEGLLARGLTLRAGFPQGAKADQALDLLFRVPTGPRLACPLAQTDPPLPMTSMPHGAVVMTGLPAWIGRGAVLPVAINLLNLGTTTWAGLDPDPAARFDLRIRWTMFSEGHREYSLGAQRVEIPWNVRPGQAYRFESWVRLPTIPGTYIVAVGLGVGESPGMTGPEWRGTTTLAW